MKAGVFRVTLAGPTWDKSKLHAMLKQCLETCPHCGD
jgi:hypothetical protein